MKKYIIILFTLVLSFGSCDFLDKMPDDALTMQSVFDNADNTKRWLAGVYSLVPDPLEDYFYCKGYGYYMLTDECEITTELAPYGWQSLISAQQGSWTPTTALPGTDLWKMTYQKVRAALQLIQNIKPLPEQNQPEAFTEGYKNEARFLMAYYYTRLLEVYGPCPLITEESGLINVDASVDDMPVERVPYDEIVDYLDNQLLQLSKVLPDSYSGLDVGRATKGMCLAVRARMLMFAASPLFNGNPYYANMKTADGKNLINPTYDPTKWRRAADAVKLVLDMPNFELYKENNPDGSIDAIMSCINLHLTTVPQNREIIFIFPGSTNGDYETHLLPRGSYLYGSIGTTQNAVDAFFMRDGKPIDDEVFADHSTLYSESSNTTEDIYYNTAYHWADVDKTEGLVVRRGTFNMYANREPRFYANIRYNGLNDPFKEGVIGDHNFKYGGEDGKGVGVHDYPMCGYQVNKAIDPDGKGGTHKYHPGIIIRLAEMYLDYAEALNECDPGNSDILAYVNLIRERAGIPGLASGLSQDAMREAIQRERRVEFFWEGGMRYMDLRRWLKMEDMVKTPIYGMNIDARTDAEFFKRTLVSTHKFTKNMYLWPIRQTEIDNSKNRIVQNTGY